MKLPSALLLLAAASGSLLFSCQSVDETPGRVSSLYTGPSQTSSSYDSGKTTEASAPATRSAASSSATSAMAFPTGDAATSALLVEKFMPAEVQANRPFDYEIHVTNLTSLSLENVIVNETMPANFQLATSSPAVTNAAMGSGAFALGTMAPNEARTIRISGMATGTGSIDTCSTVEYNAGLCASTTVVQPALNVVADGPAQVSTCDDLCYNYTVTNGGTGTARNVVLTGQLPEGMRTESGSTSFSKSIGDLEAGQSETVEICAAISGKGTYGHLVTANADGDLSAQSEMISTVATQPMLAMTKTGPAKTYGGRNINYVIEVSNIGDGIADNVEVVDMLPRGATFRSATNIGEPEDGKLSWDLGALEPGASRTLEVSLKATEHGVVTNTARATADCADPVDASVSTEVVGIPAILLEVIDLEDPIEVGEQVTYEISVENQGTAPDTGISITCVLPPNVEYVSSEGTSTAMAEATLTGNTLTFPKHPRLDAKDKVIYTVTVRANSPADARFRVALNSDELTSSVDETEATNYYE